MSRPPTFTPPPAPVPARCTPSAGTSPCWTRRLLRDHGAPSSCCPGTPAARRTSSRCCNRSPTCGYRAVTVDGRGQYESDGTDRQESYTQGELARDVLAQTAALGLGDGAVDLLGHSLGGQIARAAVLLDSAPFRSLTLMSSGPAEVVEAQQIKLKILGDALATMSMDDVWAAMRAFDPCGRGRDGRRGAAAALAAPPPRAADRHRPPARHRTGPGGRARRHGAAGPCHLRRTRRRLAGPAARRDRGTPRRAPDPDRGRRALPQHGPAGTDGGCPRCLLGRPVGGCEDTDGPRGGGRCQYCA